MIELGIPLEGITATQQRTTYPLRDMIRKRESGETIMWPEDGHTGVWSEVVFSYKDGNEPSVVITHLQDARDTHFVVAHCRVEFLRGTPLPVWLDFKWFELCPHLGQCYSLIIDRHDGNTKDLQKSLKMASEYAEQLHLFLQKSKNRFEAAAEAWAGLNELIRQINREPLPPLEQLIKMLLNYKEMEEKLKRLQSRNPW